MAENISAKQQRLWSLHDKARTKGERRSIELQIDELEKQKRKLYKDVIEPPTKDKPL